ncbi:LysR family transcriptional regulator [Brevibacillus humidisoli]|uniref:LysR family transcriptional regulator n=1 Tax=Brevibacillus humidisoli TaxID=2895522 RepID=UPI001E2CE63B|nr:LysR family transcriptional regulator [Brevibacillus humidisoli]UFJ40752.1 LysR family transcriptional regulator [Brevibacillus humidisoli]
MNPESIRTFLLVAETQSFTKTADVMRVTQSTVTSRIQTLEKELGITLFARTKRSVELTEAGRSIYPLLAESERLWDKSREIAAAANRHTRYTFGATHSVWPMVVDCLQPLLTAESTSVECKTGHSIDVLDWVKKGLVDLGFVYVEPEEQGIEYVILDRKKLVLVQHVSLPDDAPFLYNSWGYEFDSWFEQAAETFDKKVVVDQYALLIELVHRGLGKTYLPEDLARPYLTQGIWRKLAHSDEPPPLAIYQIWSAAAGDPLGRFA